MLVYEWPQELHQKFFNETSKPVENTETTEFLSGRKVSRQINTKKLMSYKMNIEFSKRELALFWIWYNDSLGQNANAFTCPAIGEGVYRFVSVPEPEGTGQKSRILSMEIEEVV